MSKGFVSRLAAKAKNSLLQSREKVKERAIFGITTHFSPPEIMKNFRTAPAFLKGKTVLNIGEGKGKFREFCEKNGAKYYGIEPKQFLQGRKKPAITATAQALPFKNDCFHIVLDHYSVFCRARSIEEQKKIITEALRVGKTFIAYPVSASRELKEWLEVSGFSFELKPPFLLEVYRKN